MAISRLHTKLETFNRDYITNCFHFQFVSFISYATQTASWVVWMHFLKLEIEMFINRNRNGNKRRRRRRNEKRLYLNWRLFYVLKLQFFSLWRLKWIGCCFQPVRWWSRRQSDIILLPPVCWFKLLLFLYFFDEVNRWRKIIISRACSLLFLNS